MVQSSIQAWEDFFKRYYWENILELAKDYPQIRSLVIQFPDIERFDMELARELLEHPESVMKHANEALSSIDLPADVVFTNIHVRIVKIPERIQIRELRSSNINKFIAVAGLIRKATEVRPKIVNAAFKCQRCGDVTFMPQAEGKFVEPFECQSDACGRK
jgi:replicative DNA helicase Mcm